MSAPAGGEQRAQAAHAHTGAETEEVMHAEQQQES